MIYESLLRTAMSYPVDPDTGESTLTSSKVAPLSLEDCINLAEDLIGNGLIKSYGIELVPIATNPGEVPPDTVWINSSNGHIYRGDVDLESGVGLSVGFVRGELPSGQINGVNTLFSTQKQFIPNTTSLYINGLRNRLGIDYYEVGDSQIATDQPPFEGDSLSIDYQYNL